MDELLHKAAMTIEQLTEAHYNDEELSLEEFEEARNLSSELLETFHDPARSRFTVPEKGSRVESHSSPKWMHPLTVVEQTGELAGESTVSEDDDRNIVQYWREEKYRGVDPHAPVVICETRHGKELKFPADQLRQI